MTDLIQRIAHAGRKLGLDWDAVGLDRTWRRLVRMRRQRARRRAALATGTALLSLVVVLVAIEGRRATSPRGRETAAQSNKPADPRGLLPLADGSRVFALQAESRVNLTHESAERTLLEVTRGGARFEVVPNRSRTFSVAAGGVTVTALGTIFTVDRVADRVGVAVARGEVLVDWRVGSRRLRAGEDGWFPPLVIAAPAPRAIDAEPAPVRLPARARVAAAGKPGASSIPAAGGASSAPAEGGAAAPLDPGGAPGRFTPAPQRAGEPVRPRGHEPAAEPAAAPSRGDDSAAARLLAAADEARLAGRSGEGAGLLDRLVREHPADPRAPVAAFSLGRLLLRELGRPEDAAQAFARAEQYLRLYPTGRRAQAVRTLVGL